MQRSLTQREIEECLYEDLPSGPESEASSDEDENLDTPEWPVSKSILDVCGADVQNIHEELFDDEDDIPLSNFVSQNNIVSSTTLQPPKWKRTFSMDIPGEFVESVGLADHIISLEDVTPLRLFRMFWTENLVEVISFQTNPYATQEGKPFSPTSPSEIQTFLTINMVMGIRHQPLRGPPRRCAFCSTKSVPVRTVWQCRTCHVPLCLRKGKTCFPDFHKK